MLLTRRGFTTALTGAVAAPALIRSSFAQGATVKIGMVVPMTGAAAESGSFAQTGAKIALEQVNKAGGVLGKPLELVFEDDQTTNPGAVLAFSKLASQPEIVAFLGSIRSTQMHAMAPDMLKIGKPVGFGGTDPNLTKLGNPWLFRFRPNDSYSGKVIAQYGGKELGKKKWAIVHSTDAFGTAGAKALEDSLGDNGGTLALKQGYANQSQDFTPVVLAVRQSGADVLGTYFTFETDLGIFARQLRQLGVNIPWVGSPSIVNVSALKLAGPALYNTYGVADYAEDSSEASKAFGKAYREVRKVAPDNQSSWTFDAVTCLALAMNKAGSTEPEKVRQAMLAIRGHKGAEGEYNFDKNGDGLHGYNIVKNDKGEIKFDKRIDFTPNLG
ncbi:MULTISPECIES: ABC transporter substrate-binding protein [unclassified Bosea (in: a-proteobacteria)]|uniref:ABC transporter substrate-binding protein n=1 Tax=unclassified Bosea (in: a-proteobacteria) TaxID=2653178 RepID=UPI0009562138|nr:MULTISPECIES: ABC transporter substrate-binding protein [unclassified Bosea (in: a-proteobacteria)]TAJ28916.1 MAG: ABC transporter substrate-binding protein [Bosea sp. (in: a-proteobacteria)]SIR13123.1 amino acid/amide ABC transporter substrate-binding protein, HAAT family [Bosea sp. TND4EK4]